MHCGGDPFIVEVVAAATEGRLLFHGEGDAKSAYRESTLYGEGAGTSTEILLPWRKWEEDIISDRGVLPDEDLPLLVPHSPSSSASAVP